MASIAGDGTRWRSALGTYIRVGSGSDHGRRRGAGLAGTSLLSIRGGLARWHRAAVTKGRELGRTPRLLVIGTNTIHRNSKTVNGDSGSRRALRCSREVGSGCDNCYSDEGGRAGL